MIPEFVTQSKETTRPEHLPRPKPCEVFERRCLSKTKLLRPQIAELMGVSEKHLSRFINGHVNVTIEFARKLESCTNISAGAWMHYQTQYDLYKTAEQVKPKTLIYD